MMNPSDSFDITGKGITLIGSTGILGTQYVKYLASRGAKVIVGDVNIEECQKLSTEVNRDYPNSCIPLFIDLYDEQAIHLFYKNSIQALESLDVVINNSQVKPKGFYDTFEKYSKSTLMKVLEGNLVGITISCQLACRHFLEQGKGNIINVSSIYGITGADQRLYDGVENIYSADDKFCSPVSYAVSKAGVVNLTKYLASYYREKNIRVNCLTPGGVYDNHDESFNQNYSYRTLLGRMANRDEYNGAIHFLASDASSYMTGANVVVDGGWTSI